MQDYPITEGLIAAAIILISAILGGWITYLLTRSRYKKQLLNSEARFSQKVQSHDALFDRFKMAENQYKDLNIRFRDMEGQHQRLLTNYKRAEDDLNEQMEKLKVSKAQRFDLVQQIQIISPFKKRYEDIIPKFESLLSLNHDLKLYISQIQTQNKSLWLALEELTEYKRQFEELIPKYKHMKQEAKQLEEASFQIKTDFQNLFNQKEEVQNKLYEIQLLYEGDKRQMSEQKIHITELEADKRNIQEELSDSLHKLSELDQKYISQNQHITELQSIKEELIQKNEVLTKELQDQEYSISEEKVQNLARAFGEVIVELDKTVNERDKLLAEKTDISRDTETYQYKYENLLFEVKSQQEHARMMQDQLEDLFDENKRLKDSLKNYRLLKKQIRLLQRDIYQTRQYNEELHTMLANEQVAISAKELALSQAQDNLKQLETQLKNGNSRKQSQRINGLISLIEDEEKSEMEDRESWLEDSVFNEPTSNQEIILSRISARAKEINFDRIGIASLSEKDNLKLIKGIGPFIEKKLNSIGIFTFKQIASFTQEDEEKVNDVIEFFPGRIRRDEWVIQAKELVEAKD